MWEHLERLRSTSDDPWLIYGEFNETLWQHEHFSRSSHGENKKSAFWGTLTVRQLTDQGFMGLSFTYDNRQRVERNVHIRLNRACVDEAWGDLFPPSCVRHLVSPWSDHCPILLQLEEENTVQRRRSFRRYEIMWEHDPMLPEVIANAWARWLIL